jgi:hypothetical protein
MQTVCRRTGDQQRSGYAATPTIAGQAGQRFARFRVFSLRDESMGSGEYPRSKGLWALRIPGGKSDSRGASSPLTQPQLVETDPEKVRRGSGNRSHLEPAVEAETRSARCAPLCRQARLGRAARGSLGRPRPSVGGVAPVSGKFRGVFAESEDQPHPIVSLDEVRRRLGGSSGSVMT